MKKIILSISTMLLSIVALQAQMYITKTGHAKFISEKSPKSITADNYKMASTLNTSTGEMVFSVPIQSFEFKNSLMQKHFNQEKFMDSQKFPKSKFKGKIVDLSKVNFSKDGTYNVEVKGDITIKGTTKTITEKGTIEVKGEEILAKSTFVVLKSDFKIEGPGKIGDKIKVVLDLNYKAKK